MNLLQFFEVLTLGMTLGAILVVILANYMEWLP